MARGVVRRLFIARACPGFLIGAKTEGLIIEDEFRRAESGVRVLGWGSKPTPHQLGSLGSVLSSAPSAQRFSTIFSTEDGLS